ncbi:MAG: TIGR04282 family arsenosugar biosynthesis glycosyltransferase, partial [Methylococcales bacterium]|nr:TIGR04282 family arsenosugar biosynthesis glycosyltransferase [Methylococcales bacterium]
MINKSLDTAVLIFCKAPIAGYVKTRLTPPLSSQQAATIHRELTIRLLSLLAALDAYALQLWCSPDTHHPFFKHCQQHYNLSLHQQHGDDLGVRMHHAIETALTTFPKVLLVGCDCPSLTHVDFEFARQALQTQKDIVLAPAEDGGYVMIAMKKPYPEIFLNKTWGHQQVLDKTRQSIQQLGINLTETRVQWDVDTFDDLQRFFKIDKTEIV